MKAIFKKELSGYFNSPIGCIFMGFFIFVTALTFFFGPIMYQTADMSYVFQNFNMMNMFLISILTMRSFSEERNKKTDQLLLTAPVSIWDIVLGKYFAALAVLGVTLLISLVMPLTMFIFGNPSVAECIGSYIGVILLCSVFIAVGMLVSSLTESQIIAAIITFVVLFLLYNLDYIFGGFSNPVLSGIAGWLSVSRRYSEFQNGMLNIESIVFYLSYVFLVLFITVRVIDKRRYS